jgi:hypothetical protein
VLGGNARRKTLMKTESKAPKVIVDTFKASPENEKKHKADAKKREADLKKPAFVPAFVPHKADRKSVV